MCCSNRAPRGGYFNPRSREGSDSAPCGGVARQRDFNPRSREGSDPEEEYALQSQLAFQSTLP